MAMMLLLGEFFDQMGIALCFMASLILVAVSIDAWLIKRHSLAATFGFVVTLAIGGAILGTAIRFLV